MNIKLLELRDRGTFIPIIAIEMRPDQEGPERRYLLRRCGYAADCSTIAIAPLRADRDWFCCDPYDWGDRTYKVAHNYIIENWDKLGDGEVVDVQFILGETSAPKQSERYSSVG